MLQPAHEYYAVLQRDYATRIRQLVPRYDELVRCIVAALCERSPTTVLDIGAGDGSLSRVVLEALPDARLTAVDASPDMAAEAARQLEPFRDRATVVRTDILQLEPPEPFDAVFSNLVLHNIPFPEKRQLLATIAGWLGGEGLFLWGDLIRHPDPVVQQQLVSERRAFALSEGCPEDIVEWNFHKEAGDDYPFTTVKAAEALKRAGFGAVRLVWEHDTFALFLAEGT
jgi:ubiquinone/menaquinone biosynthesis C-methylase UbiE